MIEEWITKRDDFEYVLCLDVSRWGRFQDIDLSAQFSAICKKNKKQVIYTTMASRGKTICEDLNRDGVPSPSGRRWAAGSVLARLRNEKYAGTMVYNQTSGKLKTPKHPNTVPRNGDRPHGRQRRPRVQRPRFSCKVAYFSIRVHSANLFACGVAFDNSSDVFHLDGDVVRLRPNWRISSAERIPFLSVSASIKKGCEPASSAVMVPS